MRPTIRREYPKAPIAAVGAVVLDPKQRVLLIRRGQEPNRGAWSLPGGAVELGESLEDAIRREILEETGLLVGPVRVVEVLDRILHDNEGRVRYHYVLVDYVCVATGGELGCASDATDLVWVLEEELDPNADTYRLPAFTLQVIRKAFAFNKGDPAILTQLPPLP